MSNLISREVTRNWEEHFYFTTCQKLRWRNGWKKKSDRKTNTPCAVTLFHFRANWENGEDFFCGHITLFPTTTSSELYLPLGNKGELFIASVDLGYTPRRLQNNYLLCTIKKKVSFPTALGLKFRGAQCMWNSTWRVKEIFRDHQADLDSLSCAWLAVKADKSCLDSSPLLSEKLTLCAPV